MTSEKIDSTDDEASSTDGSTTSLLALTRKLRRSLLENQQEYHRELRSLQQQLEAAKQATPSLPDPGEVQRLELRLAGANKVMAASKAKAERLEAQLKVAQDEREDIATQIADLQKRLSAKAEIEVALRNSQTEAELALSNAQAELASVQATLQETSSQLELSRTEISRLQLEKESDHQLSDISATDAEEALETALQEKEQLNESLAALTQLLEETQHAHHEVLQEKDDQLQDREELNATYEETIETTLRENEKLRSQLASLTSEKMQLSDLKERIANDLAEVRRKGSARLRELEQNCRELEQERNDVLKNLSTFQSELHGSTKMRQILENRASAAEELEAENQRLQQKLIAQYSAIELADKEAQKAKAEAFENRKKVLELYNQAESAELMETGRKKAERRAEEKASEADALKAQLEESQRKYEELQLQIQDLQSQPSGSSIQKFLGRISGPLRPMSGEYETQTFKLDEPES